MKINKIFMVIMLSVVFMTMPSEVKTISWRDYIPNVAAWVTNAINRVNDYADRIRIFIMYGSKYPEVRNKAITMKYLEQAKAVIMGSANYIKMLDRMQSFDIDPNSQEICNFMQTFVQNYVKANDQTRNMVKEEHQLFNARLKALRDKNIDWFKITCLTNRFFVNESDAFINALAFFYYLKNFDVMWTNDKTLDEAIVKIDEMVLPDKNIIKIVD